MNTSGVLQGVIDQFGRRVACLRELVQNAIDADTDQIDVVFDEADGLKRITVADYGCGMTLQHIDEYLLNVFKSSKDDDLESIGRFGIGFVSVFALKPKYVVVETSKGDEHTRLVIDESMGLQYFRGEPRLGTAVSLYLQMTDSAFDTLIGEGIAFVEQSCRYIEVELGVIARGKERVLSVPFELDLPIRSSWSEPGTEIRVGYGGAPFYCLMNRRLVLEQGERALLPGVSVLATSRDIEHNLARNAVIQDGNFERFMKRTRRLVEEELFPQLVQRARERQGGQQTLDAVVAILSGFSDGSALTAPYNALLELPVIPALQQGATIYLRIEQLRSLHRSGALVSASGPSALACAVSQARTVVLNPADWPTLGLVEAHLDARLDDVEQTFSACLPATGSAAHRFAALIEAMRRLHVATAAVRFYCNGEPPAAVMCADTVQVWRKSQWPASGDLLALNSALPLARRLASMAADRPAEAAVLTVHWLESAGVRIPAAANAALDEFLDDLLEKAERRADG